MMQPSLQRRGSSHLGPITLVLLLLGVVCGVGLSALMVHSIQITQQALRSPALQSAQPLLGVVVDSALTVVSVDRGGAAAHAGIRIGDVLTALNGVSLESAATTRQRLIAALKLPDGRHLTLLLRRAGQQLSLSIVLSITAPSRSSTRESPSASGAVYYF